MSYQKYIQPNTRAYATLAVKTSDRGDGTITGTASTPELDRAGDILLPEGAVFNLPICLLWQHDHEKPIGHVTSAKVGRRGIDIVGKIAIGATPEIDNAYRLISAGLVRGLSVGFRALERPEASSTGYVYRSWELLELSVVTLPANARATITSVKAACGLPSVLDAIPLVDRRKGSIRLRTGAVKLIQPPIRLVGSR